MAREWIEIVEEIEGQYPTARGASGQDTRLQLLLSRCANSFFKSMERKRRWSLAYKVMNVVTTPGVAVYTIPAPVLLMSHVYYLRPTGMPVVMDSYDAMELRAMYGEGSNSVPGAPRFFAVEGTQVQIFPKPDDNAGANYTMVFEGYQSLVPLVETIGTTTANNATLTVPSTVYLSDRGIANAGASLSVRAVDNAGPNGPSTLLTDWTALATPTTVTMADNAIAAASNVQVFFNSLNWLIQDYDLVVLFGVLREVAAYEKENYTIWAQRLNDELDEMQQFDVDRRRTLISDATGLTAQRLAELARLDSRIFWGGLPFGAWW